MDSGLSAFASLRRRPGMTPQRMRSSKSNELAALSKSICMAMRAAPQREIPVFRLYGEPGEPMVPGFVHVERISSRAPLHDWEIRAHRHAHLSQAFLVAAGQGVQRIDDQESRFVAPWLMWIPAQTV